MKSWTTMITLLIFMINGNAEEAKRYTASGYVNDAFTGEELIGATVYVVELEKGTVSNLYGYYSLSLEPGTYQVIFSYIGYASKTKEIVLDGNIELNVQLIPSSEEIDEVEISAEKPNANITRTEMGIAALPSKKIKKIPALLGEVDVIKAIQLLPGVQSTSEGSSGFSVRGGSADQNLILLDEATVYNASHLMGFFSVFNNDAIKDVKLYKGDIPASAGGRLSSLLDIRMKDGNSKRFAASGGIGTISSRLTLESPIFNENTSFLLSGRRTYMDIFLPLANNEDIQDNRLFFYDLNLKINHIINENNRIFASGYFGRDIFKSQFAGLGFGNNTFTLRWNHLFSQKIFMNVSLIRSQFDYSLSTAEGEPNSFKWTSNLLDHSVKIDFDYYPLPAHDVQFGLMTVHHRFEPGTARGIGDESFISKFELPDNYALEHAVYATNEQEIGYHWKIRYGLRYSLFQNIGEAFLYEYNDDYQAVDSLKYGSGEIFNDHGGLSPRLGVTYKISEFNSIKSSYSRTHQFIHQASNSTAGTPLDIWFPSSPNVAPQMADQIALGYFHNFFDNTMETSVEAYYKKINNAIDFKDNASLLLNPKLEGELRFGTAEAYGVEFLVNYTFKKLSGWISYTRSRVYRTINTVNDGDPYPAPYDKPDDISIVASYDLLPRITLSGNWVYATGAPVTFPTGRMVVGNTVIPVYSERNSYRMPDYHRLDISFTWKSKEKPGRRWSSDLNLSFYNAYARKNPWSISFIEDPDNPGETYAEMTYLFSIVPAITYNFRF
jgi:hypothetical protein